MTRTIFLIIALLVSLLPGAASASAPARPLTTDRVVKTACAYAFGYANIDQLKSDLLAQAKRLAVNELFGEFITASTAVENFVVTSDQIRSSSVGFVRIEGDLEYRNGSNLAEVCITVVAYVTEEDRAQFAPVQLTKRHCVTDPKLTTSEIRAFAREEVLVQALIDYDSKLKDADRNTLLRLIQRVQYVDSGFVPETETYCVSATGTVVPIEVMAYQQLNEETSGEQADISTAFINTRVGQMIVHPIEAPSGTAVIHYHRPDGRYTGWTLHVWEDTAEEVTWTEPLLPAGTTLTSIYFIVGLKADAKQVGFIVHKGELKDPGADMFLDVSQNGTQVWVISGDQRIYTSNPTGETATSSPPDSGQTATSVFTTTNQSTQLSPTTSARIIVSGADSTLLRYPQQPIDAEPLLADVQPKISVSYAIALTQHFFAPPPTEMDERLAQVKARVSVEYSSAVGVKPLLFPSALFFENQ